MRKVEQIIVNNLKRGIVGKISERDRILRRMGDDMLCYALWGTVVARKEPFSNELSLGVWNADWQTNTTKSRINAIATAFGVPRIRQKNHKWIWSDGVAYTEPRVFFVEYSTKSAPL